MISYKQHIHTPEYAYFYEITYRVNGRNKNKKGVMNGTGADAVILQLLDQYPNCKGRVGRECHEQKESVRAAVKL